jgi:squalene synthase HpnC
MLVRKKGLEPPRLTALEPKSSASTNSATFARFSKRHFSANALAPLIAIRVFYRQYRRQSPCFHNYNCAKARIRADLGHSWHRFRIESSAVPVEHYENFPVASLLLPKHLRHPIEVIYAFARSADDFADEGNLAAEERLALLDEYHHQLQLIRTHDTPNTPLFRELATVIAQHQLPIDLFVDLIDAFKQDVRKNRYANFAELMDYCRRSADPIGRLLLHLNKAATAQNLQWSDAICSALQLINHWQDVAIDWQKNETGRVYLPQDDLEKFDLSDSDIARAQAGASIDEKWRKMMRFQCDRARAMMHAGRPLTYAMPGRFGAELRLITAGGLRILDKIDAVNGDVFRHRPKLGKWDWLRIAPRAVLPFLSQK